MDLFQFNEDDENAISDWPEDSNNTMYIFKRISSFEESLACPICQVSIIRWFNYALHLINRAYMIILKYSTVVIPFVPYVLGRYGIRSIFYNLYPYVIRTFSISISYSIVQILKFVPLAEKKLTPQILGLIELLQKQCLALN